jgi:hypothetical protein
MMGLFSLGYWITRAIASLVTVLIAAFVGGMLYNEAGGVRHTKAPLGLSE